jgi:hypothetical protein
MALQIKSFILVIAVGLSGCQTNSSPNTNSSPAEVFVLTGKDIAEIENGTRYVLKDPESAMFRDIQALKRGNVTTICGWVNAKNSFGGYTGYVPFTGFLMLLSDKPRVPSYTFSVMGGSELESNYVIENCRKAGFLTF